MISYGRQSISDEDIAAVVDVLKSDMITQGPKIIEFEDVISKYTEARFATAVNSATSAIHISLLALGIGDDDLVWTSPNTFVATANAVKLCGAKIDFVDIDPHTRNLSVEALKLKLDEAAGVGKLPKAIIPVHFSGLSCDMKSIHKLATKYKIKIIEDASHGLGGSYNNYKVGSCRYSDICVFSFHPVKIITTAEGGVATTNSLFLDKRIKLLRSHGVTRDQKDMFNENPESWYYEQHHLGLNYRLNDMQAALGLSQMKRLDIFVKGRRKIAEMYDEQLKDLPLILPKNSTDSAWHLYVVECENTKTRNLLHRFLKNRQILTNVHYIPVHLHPFYQELGFNSGDFPNAERYSDRCLSLPIYPDLGSSQNLVVNSLVDFFS